MSRRDKCCYAEECKLFKGEEKISETPLLIFRNVFCYRGMKGWKNCKKFNELEQQKKQKRI